MPLCPQLFTRGPTWYRARPLTVRTIGRLIQTYKYDTNAIISKHYLLTLWSSVFEKLTGSQLVKKFSAFLHNLKVYYRMHTCPPPVPIISQSNPVHIPHPTSLRSTLILSSHLRQVPLSKPCMHLSSIRATCPAHLILLDLLTRTIFGEGYRS